MMEAARTSQEPPACPLCGAREAVALLARHRGRSFYRCGVCRLVFVPSAQHPTPAAARRRYDLHRNSPSDAGYCRFLGRLIAPLAERLAPGAEGLDFGSGPTPVLSRLLTERGFRMTLYDLHYASDRAALGRTYDFAVSCETLEHLAEPGKDLELLRRLVRPGGWLAIMTGLATAETDFTSWHYAADETHVCFFSRETLAWWFARRGLSAEFPGPNLCFVQVNTSPAVPARV